MIYIEFKATGSNLRRTDSNKIVSYTQNELGARFELNSDWNDLSPIVAIFSKDGGTAYDMILDSNNECVVPWEVLQGKGILTVSLVGGSTLTSTEVEINVLTTGQLGGLVSKPTDTLYQQLLNKYNTVEADWTSCKTLLDTYKSTISASEDSINASVLSAQNNSEIAKESANKATEIAESINASAETIEENSGKISAINGAIADISGSVLADWESGSIHSGTGANAVQNARIRNVGYLQNNITVTLGSGLKCMAVYFDSDYSVVASSAFVTGEYTFNNANATYIRLIVGYSDDRTIDTSEVLNTASLIGIKLKNSRLVEIETNVDKALKYGDILPFYFFGEITLGGNLDTRDGSEVSQINRARTQLVTVPYDCSITSTDYNIRIFIYDKNGNFESFNVSKKLYKGDNVRLVFMPKDNSEITDIATIFNDVKIKAGVNKTEWYALGDSITQGFYNEGNTPSTLKVTTDCWAKTVANAKNFKLTNYGVGGSGFVHNGTVLDKLNARDHVDTIDFSKANLVTVAYGVNDWKYNMPLGSMADDIATGGTIYSNMRYVIEKILKDNPACKIVVITPINCSAYGTEDTNWGLGCSFTNNGTLEDIFNAETEICSYYGIEYIDMTHKSLFNRKNITELLIDGVHPKNVEVHQAMGQEIAAKMPFMNI